MSPETRRATQQDCAQLIARYANLNDQGDWPAVAALFVPEGRLARPTAQDEWIEGRDAILASLLARPARRTRHVVGTIEISPIDADQATGRSALILYIANDQAKVGSFDDRFLRTDDGWRFLERRGSLTF